tara:strand:+ start:165135 stop:166250 length:1116 start_codon:yes stop_codon:yes gene_type:complete
MNILLFSDDRVLYEDGEKGAVISILIPRYSKIKKYADITAPTDNTVKLRHGDADDLPALWRQEGPYVNVFGNLSLDLDEKRATNSMYLPQDFVGDDVGAFYYIIDDRFVIHGVKSMTDDGHYIWGTSLIGEKEENTTDIVVSSISERMLEGKDERIIVAVHGSDESKEVLKEALEPFEQEVINFKDLGTPKKEIRPLFARSDRSLIMLTLSLCTFLAMSAFVFLWVNSQIELEAQKDNVLELQDAISRMQKNKELGYIKNPKDLLNVMDMSIPLPPSTLVHNAGEVGAMFGDLKSIEMGTVSRSLKGRSVAATTGYGVYDVDLKVEAPNNSLLLDQERIAKTVVESMPWIKYVERPQAGIENELKVGIQVK